jgi:hypothetical protein
MLQSFLLFCQHWRYYPRQEPYAVILHVRIRAEGRPRGRFLPRQPFNRGACPADQSKGSKRSEKIVIKASSGQNNCEEQAVNRRSHGPGIQRSQTARALCSHRSPGIKRVVWLSESDGFSASTPSVDSRSSQSSDFLLCSVLCINSRGSDPPHARR